MKSIQKAYLIRVVDGDTLKVRFPDGMTDRVRLIGIDAPESVCSREYRNTPEGIASSRFLSFILPEGTVLWLEADKLDRDDFGRLLRYVWLHRPPEKPQALDICHDMLNAILIIRGAVMAKAYPPNVFYQSLFNLLGHEAIKRGVGLTGHWA